MMPRSSRIAIDIVLDLALDIALDIAAGTAVDQTGNISSAQKGFSSRSRPFATLGTR